MEPCRTAYILPNALSGQRTLGRGLGSGLQTCSERVKVFDPHRPCVPPRHGPPPRLLLWSRKAGRHRSLAALAAVCNRLPQSEWQSSPCLLLLLLLLLSRFSRVRLCATPETAAHQAPPSLGFSRQEHWSGLPFPSPMNESEK